jgi:hypothetical protein
MASEDQLIEDLREFAEEIGEPPTTEQMNEDGPWSDGVYFNYFNSWTDALRKADLSPKKISDEKLIKDLQSFVDSLGETPTKQKMNSSGPHGATTYSNRFGSWNDALREAGLKPVHCKQTATEEELISSLTEVADELGETPSVNQMREHGDWSPNTYQKIFGSWNDALREAGLELNREKSGNATKEKLIADLQRVSKKIGKTPNYTEYDEYGEWTAGTCSRNFGSWENALAEANLKKEKVTKEQLLEDLKEFAEDMDTTPTSIEMEKYGPWPRYKYYRAFGTWPDTLRKVGMRPSQKSANSIESDYKENKQSKILYEKMRDAVLHRDDNSCRVCKQREDLNVHHIKPRRKFDDIIDSHTLDNLVCLCRECHGLFEGRWQDADPDEFVENAREMTESFK